MARTGDAAEIADLLGLTPLPPIADEGASGVELARQIGARVREARVRSGLGAAAVAEAFRCELLPPAREGRSWTLDVVVTDGD